MNTFAPVEIPVDLEVGATYLGTRRWLAWYTICNGQEQLGKVYFTREAAYKAAISSGEAAIAKRDAARHCQGLSA
ncbi:MAG: hypothetical protein ABNH26_08645 [Celeribacter sp.]|jgi:hypothetical protein